VWRRATGLRRAGAPNGVYGTEDPRSALNHVIMSESPALYVFHGLGPELDKPEVADLLREAAHRLAGRSGAVVLTGGGVKLPESLRPEVGPLHLPLPARDEYLALLQRVVKDLTARASVQVSLTPADEDRLLANLQGLTLGESEKLLTRVIVEDGRLDATDITHVLEAKRELVERDGVLEYQPAAQSLDEVADLVHLKEWLGKRKRFMEDPRRAEEFGLEFPRGILLVGVPGCGKSLCAKAVAAAWALPLVRLDPGALYDKYIGETEQNFRKAVESADRLAPLVLWIDELEKAFAAGGGDEDGGTSLRVLGSFLSWLQERKGDVFVVATANDVQRLPAELLRKGRFDETFFVDLPDEAARASILAIHLRRRKQAPEQFDLAALARESDGYSGAELEQVVISALYTAFSAGAPLTMQLLRDELRATPPIVSTAREKIAFLRQWADGRTVPAN
jgi:SpoVK/Ycf46/Vps4 family AAA+-type ATPase